MKISVLPDLFMLFLGVWGVAAFSDKLCVSL